MLHLNSPVRLISDRKPKVFNLRLAASNLPWQALIRLGDSSPAIGRGGCILLQVVVNSSFIKLGFELPVLGIRYGLSKFSGFEGFEMVPL